MNRFQISKVRNIVYEADPAAWVTIMDVSDVLRAAKPGKKSGEKACNFLENEVR